MLLSHSCGETNGYLQCEGSVVYFKALLFFWLLAVMINLSRCQLNHPTLVWKKLMTASRHYLSCVNYASHSGDWSVRFRTSPKVIPLMCLSTQVWIYSIVTQKVTLIKAKAVNLREEEKSLWLLSETQPKDLFSFPS